MRIERSASTESHYETDEESRTKRESKLKRQLSRREYRRLKTSGASPVGQHMHRSNTMRNKLATVWPQEQPSETLEEKQPTTIQVEEEAKGTKDPPAAMSVSVTETELEEDSAANKRPSWYNLVL